MKIGLTSIYVNDPQVAFSFYTKILGFKEMMYIPEHGLAIVVSPENPEGTALLLEPNDNPWARTYQQAIYDKGLAAIVFTVTNLDEEYKKLSDAGVGFIKEPTRTEWGYEALLDDSCGNLVQLNQQ